MVEIFVKDDKIWVICYLVLNDYWDYSFEADSFDFIMWAHGFLFWSVSQSIVLPFWGDFLLIVVCVYGYGIAYCFS